MARRNSMTLEEHDHMAEVLWDLRSRLGKVAVNDLRGHKASAKVTDEVLKAARAVDRARSLLDDQWCQDGGDPHRISPYYEHERG